MTLFESLKLFPKVDLHIDFLGSISKDTIYELTKNLNTRESIDDIIDFDSLTDYDNSRKLVISLLNTYDNIILATKNLINKLENDNMLYSEVFINLEKFYKELDREVIIKTIIDLFKESSVKINIVLEIDSSINKEELYNNINILYKYYNKGINGIYFKKNKLDNLESFRALFDKFIKDDVSYILLLDTKLTTQNKDIYFNAKRIIYNLFLEPDISFIDNIKEKNIILEFPITYQSYFNIYDDLSKHFVYDLFKEKVLISFTTIDMTPLDTDLLNEYCKLFNVFPFNLHDLISLNLNILNNINISDLDKNNLIDCFKEKANLLL